MFNIPNLHVEQHPEEIGCPLRRDKVGDVGALLGDQRADPRKRPRLIGQRQRDAGEMGGELARVLVPAQVQPAVELVFVRLQHRAVDGVNLHARLVEDADDAVARHRAATGPEADRDAAPHAAHHRRARLRQRLRRLAVLRGIDDRDHAPPGHLAGADRLQQIVHAAFAQLARGALQRLVGDLLAAPLEGLPRNVAALADVALARVLAQRALDGGARLAGHRHVHPHRRGALRLGADDLDLLAVAQPCPQRRAAPVDLGAHA